MSHSMKISQVVSIVRNFFIHEERQNGTKKRGEKERGGREKEHA